MVKKAVTANISAGRAMFGRKEEIKLMQNGCVNNTVAKEESAAATAHS